MREATLRDFFLGLVPAQQLAVEAAAAVEEIGRGARRVHVEDMGQSFAITSPMLVSLCDAVARGDLPPRLLEPIAFAIIASENLEWDFDDDVQGRVLYDWSSPEINWELTTENVAMFRGWLTGELQPPPVPKLPFDLPNGRVVSRTEKAWVPPTPSDTQGPEA